MLWPVDWTAQKTADGGRRLLTGSSDDMAADIAAFAQAGVRHVCLTFQTASLPETLERMQRFAEQVMPRYGDVLGVTSVGRNTATVIPSFIGIQPSVFARASRELDPGQQRPGPHLRAWFAHLVGFAEAQLLPCVADPFAAVQKDRDERVCIDRNPCGRKRPCATILKRRLCLAAREKTREPWPL